jgi:regulator of replication initiation timing
VIGTTIAVINVDKEKEDLRGMINTLIHQNQEMLMENKEMRSMVKEMIPKIGNTTINKFNLQVFLNEQCKDAINMSEFIGSLELELADLDDTRRNGYVRGITNIFLRGLRKLELHQRPIHCSDLKREVLYVKDNDAWEKEGSEKSKIKGAIGAVSKRQIGKIKDWEEANPGWSDSESGTQQYIDMICTLTASVDSMLDNKIIRTIAKEVSIEKSG